MEIVTLPINWVINGKVKFNAKQAKDYIIHNRQFYKKWPVYEVIPLDDKSFATYKEALLAEDILTNKTDLDTMDVENIAANEQLSTSRKRKHNDSEDLVSETSSDCEDVLPAAPVFRQDAFCVDENENIQSCIIETSNENDIPDIVQTDHTDLSNSTFISVDILTTKHLNDFRESLLKDVREIIQQEMSKFFTSNNFNLNFNKPLNITQSEFEKNNNLPLDTLDDILKLEHKIINERIFHDELFSFLNRIGGRDVREHTKMLNRIYSLALQGKINYSGREQKFGIGKLKQVKLFIDVLVQNCGVSEDKAKDEIMYFLQHLNDRIRSSGLRETK